MIKPTINKTKRFQIVFVTIVVVCALVFTFIWFSTQLHSIISDTNNSFLKETASHQAALFNTKLNDQLIVLESLSKQFESVDFNNYTELKNAVLSLHDVGDFKQLTVANSSGACMANDNTYSANISKKHYFQTALKGDATVSNGIDVDTQGEDILALSVPIYQKNKIVGVLTGTYNRSVLDSLFSTTMFNGEGYTYIIDSTGNIIVKTDNVNSLVKGSNYLEFIQKVELLTDKHEAIEQDFSQGSANTIHYKSGSQERYAAYYPIGLHDWYVVSEITDDVILNQTQDLSFITTILVSILSAILFCIFILILSTIQKAESIMIKNERFKVISAQNQSIIFDYDINKKILDISGDTDFIFGPNYPTNAPVDIEYLVAKVHPDDVSTFYKFIHTFMDGKMYRSFEFRFQCEDENYYWFRFSSTLVKEASLPSKLIGNLVNVETQKNQELSLKKEAECDPLTGLLNKKALAKYVDDFLKTQKADSVHALFIIDLDNFKSVNDTLGHVYGDKVLLEASSKLVRVFSEKDFIGRIGGDEFATFLNLSAFDNMENAKRIIIQKGASLTKALHETYKGQNNQEVTVSASIGIAIYNKDGGNYLTLYHHADNALYETKKNGKNGYSFYAESTDE